MRQRIDVDELWRSAREQSLFAYEGARQHLVSALSEESAFSLDDLLAERIDSSGLVARLRSPDGAKRNPG
jgi:hypothetical protein